MSLSLHAHSLCLDHKLKPCTSFPYFAMKNRAFITPTPLNWCAGGPRSLLCKTSPAPTSLSRNRSATPQHPTSPNRITPRSQDTLFLSPENVNIALDEVRVKLGSVFGNSVENRDIGITGQVELADLDGPVVVLRLKGRFWHKRTDVLARVSTYLQSRIPEIVDVSIEDVRQLSDTEEETTRLTPE